MKRVVVIGGGISGLSLAEALRQRGIRPQVLEAERRPGGKVQSSRIGGYLIESGPQSLRFRDPLASAQISLLGLASKLVPATGSARHRGVASGDSVLLVPTSPFAFVRSKLAPARVKARLLLDLAGPRGPASLGADESVAEFGRRHFGECGAERFFFPMVSGLYTGDPEVLSLRSAFPSLARMEKEHRSVLLGALAAIGRTASGPALATFSDGMGALTGALAARLGDDLSLGAEVKSVRKLGSGFRVAVDERGAPRELEADAVVLALPAHNAGPVLESVDPGLAAIVGRISYAPVVMVHLGYPRQSLRRLPRAYGFYIPAGEPSTLLGAVFISQLFPGHALPGHELISCRMGGARDPDAVSRPEEELVQAAHADLARLIGADTTPTFSCVVRHPRALPQYALGHRERVEAIDAAVLRHPGLYLSGNAYRGLGVLDCLRAADPLARQVAEHLSWPFVAGP